MWTSAEVAFAAGLDQRSVPRLAQRGFVTPAEPARGSGSAIRWGPPDALAVLVLAELLGDAGGPRSAYQGHPARLDRLLAAAWPVDGQVLVCRVGRWSVTTPELAVADAGGRPWRAVPLDPLLARLRSIDTRR